MFADLVKHQDDADSHGPNDRLRPVYSWMSTGKKMVPNFLTEGVRLLLTRACACWLLANVPIAIFAFTVRGKKEGEGEAVFAK